MRRSKGALHDAQRSQFLEGDIRLSHRYAELGAERLRLQQDQINFNNTMQGINTALNLTQAGVQLASAVGNLHDERAKLKQQTAQLTVMEMKERAKQDYSYNPYEEVTQVIPGKQGNASIAPVLNEDGTPQTRYRGYGDWKDPETGKTINEFLQETYTSIEGEYWLPSSKERARQRAENAFQEMELKDIMDATIQIAKDRQAVYDQTMTNYYKTRDLSGALDFIDHSNLTPQQKEAQKLMVTREMTKLTRNDNAERIAVSQGMGAVEKYLKDELNLNEGDDDYADAYTAGSKARDLATKAPREQLDKNWDDTLAEGERHRAQKDIAWFQSQRNALLRQEKDFANVDGQTQFRKHLNYIDGSIEDINRQNASRSRGGGGMSQAELDRFNMNHLHWLEDQWTQGRMKGDDVMIQMQEMSVDLSESGHTLVRSILGRIIMAEDGNWETAQALEDLNKFAADTKLPPEMLADLTKNVRAIRRNGNKDEVVKYVENIKDRAIIKLVEKRINNPNVGLSNTDRKKLNAKSYDSQLDYFDEISLNENKTYSLTEVAGSRNTMQTLLNNNREVVKDELKGSGWEIFGATEGYFEEKPEGVRDPSNGKMKYDRTGRIFYPVRNRSTGETAVVILNKDDKLEIVEMKNNKATGKLTAFDEKINTGKAAEVERVREELSTTTAKPAHAEKTKDKFHIPYEEDTATVMDRINEHREKAAKVYSMNDFAGSDKVSSKAASAAAVRQFERDITRELGEAVKITEYKNFIEEEVESFKHKVRYYELGNK